MTPGFTPGFTLVELAIVITIIGLLIGGVLKGQELLQNARMTTTSAQVKAFGSAALTFRDIYKAWPGDLQNPTNFIEGCTTSPCTISGNGDGEVGPVYIGSGPSYYNDENNNFWLHLSKAKLIGGIDPASTWTSSAYFKASLPDAAMGGKFAVVTYSHNSAPWNGIYGRYVFLMNPSADGSTIGTLIPINVFAKYDLKVDDGKPWSGDALVDVTSCGLNTGTNVYDANNATPCRYDNKLGF